MLGSSGAISMGKSCIAQWSANEQRIPFSKVDLVIGFNFEFFSSKQVI